jgi:hypothetical protein
MRLGFGEANLFSGALRYGVDHEEFRVINQLLTIPVFMAALAIRGFC